MLATTDIVDSCLRLQLLTLRIKYFYSGKTEASIIFMCQILLYVMTDFPIDYYEFITDRMRIFGDYLNFNYKLNN